MRSALVLSCATTVLILAACGQADSLRAPSRARPIAEVPANYRAFVAAPTDEQMQTLLATYCVGCHSSAHPARHVVLDTIAGATTAAAKAHAQLKNATMPPSQARQPTADESAAMDAWFVAQM